MTNFDEYIRQGEPQKREKGYAWQTAIGLQAVDGLKPSDYLIETARKDIEGEITIDEAEQLIQSYYQSKIAHTPEDTGDARSGYGIDQHSPTSYRKNICVYACWAGIDSSSDFRRHLQICGTIPRLQHYQKGVGAAW